eukprot:783911_1
MAQNLWIPMMRLIEEVSRNAASQTFDPQACRLQNVYADYLQTWLFLGLIEHQIKPDNCAHKWLIPATVYQTFCTEYHPNVAIRNMNTAKKADIRVCYLRAIGRRIELLKQSFDTEFTTTFARNASKSQWDDPYPSYHLVNNNEPPPQPPLPCTCVPFRQSPGVCFNRSELSDLCGRYPLQKATDVPFTPCTYSQNTSLNGSTCGLSQSDTHFGISGFEWNDPYPSLYPTVNNNETPQPPPHFPLCQSPTLSTFYTQSATCSQAPQSQDTSSPRLLAFGQSPAPIAFPAFPNY